MAVLTLPLTGVGPWQDWIEALRLYQLSQQNVPVLYGFGLLRFVPLWVFLALAVAALLAALAHGPRWAGPSRDGHGGRLSVALGARAAHCGAVDALLAGAWLWLAVGVTSAPDGLQWWWAVGLVAASWFCRSCAPGRRREAARRVASHCILSWRERTVARRRLG